MNLCSSLHLHSSHLGRSHHRLRLQGQGHCSGDPAVHPAPLELRCNPFLTQQPKWASQSTNCNVTLTYNPTTVLIMCIQGEKANILVVAFKVVPSKLAPTPVLPQPKTNFTKWINKHTTNDGIGSSTDLQRPVLQRLCAKLTRAKSWISTHWVFFFSNL